MRAETIIVPWLGPSMNTIWAGKHWSFRKKVASEAHMAVLAATRKVELFVGPVAITFYPKQSGRLFDASNHAVSAKAIEDGLVLAGILIADTGDFVHRITIHRPEKVRTQSYMMVRIAEVSHE